MGQSPYIEPKREERLRRRLPVLGKRRYPAIAMAVPFGTVPAQSGDYECRSRNLAVVGRDAVFVAPAARSRRARIVPATRKRNVQKFGFR